VDAETLEAAAYHEAGHAAICLAVGRRVTEVWARGQVGNTAYKPVKVVHPLSSGDRKRAWGACRRALLVAVAGIVAENLLDRLDGPGDDPEDWIEEDVVGYVAGPEWVPCRISAHVRAGYRGEQDHDDWKSALRFAGWLSTTRAIASLERRAAADGVEAAWATLTVPGEDGAVAEIIRAERLAERLLMRRWPAVQKLAWALLDNGRLTGKQATRLLSRKV
jgi:hypothetical protein